ncbi:MAG: S-layer homology domain-containing protein [Propionibacteriaceae bacterium]|nr:S-layer homology domain-containing protein [Propionibacteriaceae bacterium]
MTSDSRHAPQDSLSRYAVQPLPRHPAHCDCAQHKLRRRIHRPAWLAGLTALAVGITGVVGVTGLNQAHATFAGFQAGNIMSDAVMGAANSMSVAQIQAFLDGKNACTKPVSSGNSGGIPVVVTSASSAYLSTNSSVTYQITGGVPGTKNGTFLCLRNSTFDGQSAAQIIFDVSQKYQINPQVLIVLLQKEQSLITDTSPNSNQYKIATGYGCPDTAACNSVYYGFKNQLSNAANLFRTVLDGGWSNYPAYTTVYVQYNPSASCGGSNLYIANRATSSLYRYTPYQPNAAVLANPPGSVVACGAYGNSNFYSFFTDWFGSTQTPTTYAVVEPILTVYTANGGPTGPLGPATASQAATAAGLWQQFQNGRIYYRSDLGGFAILGPINTAYITMGGTTSPLGYPTANQGATAKGLWQQFENGRIYYRSDLGAYATLGPINTAYTAMGGTTSPLGYPAANQVTTSSNGLAQQFESGGIYYSPNLGAYAVANPINPAYVAMGATESCLGNPTAAQTKLGTGLTQQFEHGSAFWSSATGAHGVCGVIMDAYTANGGATGTLGFPRGDAYGNGACQDFQGGTLCLSAAGSVIPMQVPSSCPFTDVPTDSPYAPYVCWLASTGVTSGTSATTYSPSKDVTREQMAVFLYKLAGSPQFTPPKKPTFTDVPASSPYFPFIEWLSHTGITSGTSATTYSPGASVTREQMAVFLNKLAGSPQFTPPKKPTFTDVPASSPYFPFIEWLRQTGITSGTSATTYSPGASVTRDQMAVFLQRMAYPRLQCTQYPTGLLC